MAATVGRASESLLHFPCLCDKALGMSLHPPTCLRWQWATAVLSVFLQPGQQKDGMSISHHGISHVMRSSGPSGTLPFTSGTGYAHGAIESHHSPGGTTLVCVFYTAIVISADLCKSRLTPLKLVDLLWVKRGPAKGQLGLVLLPMEAEMLSTRAGPLIAPSMQTWVWMRPKSRIMTAHLCGQDVCSRTPHLFAKSPCFDSQIHRG